MNSLVALVLLGQIIGCTFIHAWQIRFNCTGKYAATLAGSAVNYINEHSLHGYKYALNVIKGIHFPPYVSDEEVFFLELDLLETKCYVLDPTPAENCTVRPQHHHAVKGNCDIKIFYGRHADKILATKCHSNADSVENVQRNCPKCPILLPLNDPRVVQSVEYVLHKHNEQNPNNAYLILEISRGQYKYEPEGFYLEFAIVETNCSHQDIHDHHDCHAKEEAHVGFCTATIQRSHAALEKLNDELYESDCVLFDVKKGHSYDHLIKHHFGKNIASPGHNNTILDLVHSHNYTSHNLPDHQDTYPSSLCPGKVHHFKI